MTATHTLERTTLEPIARGQAFSLRRQISTEQIQDGRKPQQLHHREPRGVLQQARALAVRSLRPVGVGLTVIGLAAVVAHFRFKVGVIPVVLFFGIAGLTLRLTHSI